MASQTERDDKLMQFLGMTEDRVDPEVARSVLEACGWDLAAAVDQIFDAGPTVGGAPAAGGTRETLLGPGGGQGAGADAGADAELQRAMDESRQMTYGLAAVEASNRRAAAPPRAEVPEARVVESRIPPPEEASLFSSLFAGNPTRASRQPAAQTGAQTGAAVFPAASEGGIMESIFGRPSASDSGPQSQGGGASQPNDTDEQMARALEESWKAQTDNGRAQTEEEQLREALAASKAHDERIQRDELKRQQDMELAESALMDEMREAEERSRREAEELVKQKIEAEELQAAATAQSLRDRVESAVAALPAEPGDGDGDRVALMFRFPNGKSAKRKFSKTNQVRHLYDYVDGKLLEFGDEETLESYTLVSTFPKITIEKSEQLISATKVENQMALVVQKA